MKIAVGNVGSTSLKIGMFESKGIEIVTLGQANLDRVNVEGLSTFKHSVGDGKTVSEQVEVFGFDKALTSILDWYQGQGIVRDLSETGAVGFKTVLAGPDRGACVLSDEVLEEMRIFAFVAPKHNMPYVQTIEQFRDVLGDIPLVGVFEPSFHQGIPRFRRLTGLPLNLEEQLGIEQKGFHGSSGRYGAECVRKMHNEYTSKKGVTFPSPFRLIYNHLGGSSSCHALYDGISVATSMKFSPQSGHFQGTRVGDIDAFAVLFAMKELGFNVKQMHDLMSNEAGLRGISGIASGEMEDILKEADGENRNAILAKEAYIDTVRQRIGAYAAVLKGVEAIAFAGGIGENGIDFRERVCEGFEYLGLELDPEKNRQACGINARITSDSSRVQAYVVKTNEEIVVAYFTKQVVELGRDLMPSEMRFRL